MADTQAKSFTSNHQIGPDGTVLFDCSADQSLWPWLSLPTHHPVLIQSITYWAAVECGMARGRLDPTLRSALTQMDWVSGKEDVGRMVRGIADPVSEETPASFGLTLYDAENERVCRMTGEGVVFRTRDFEGWRAKAKQERAGEPVDGFDFVAHERVGVATPIECFLGALDPSPRPVARALITPETGLPPNHPYLDGSGDHVNSTHLVEVARQFACLVRERSDELVTSGSMSFQRYVELGRSFQLSSSGGSDEMLVEVHQADKLCTQIKLKFA